MDEDVRQVQVRMGDPRLMHARDGLSDHRDDCLAPCTGGFAPQPLPQVDEPFGFAGDERAAVRTTGAPFHPRPQHLNRRHAALTSGFRADEFEQRPGWLTPVEIAYEVTHRPAAAVRANDSGSPLAQ